jgi:hypothetical protein
MERAPSPAASAKGSWAIWIGSVLAASTIAVATRLGVEVSRLEYETYGLKELPRPTNLALTAASNLWVAVLLSALLGIWPLRVSRRLLLAWSIVTMLAIIVAAALIAKGLALPLEAAAPAPTK